MGQGQGGLAVEIFHHRDRIFPVLELVLVLVLE